MTAMETRFDPARLPHGERLALGAVFQALANSWGAHPGREREVLALLFDKLGLNETDRARIDRLVGERRDPSPFATQIRDPDVRRALLLELLALAVANGTYDARDREGLRRLAEALDIGWGEVVAAEDRYAEALRRHVESDEAPVSVPPVGADAVPATAEPAPTASFEDLLGWGLRGLSQAAAAGAGLLLLGAGAAAAGTIEPEGDPVELSRIFSNAGRAIVADKLAALDAEPGEFAFEHLGGSGTHVFVAVPGFLSQTADFGEKWAPLNGLIDSGERYSLRWESKDLLALRDWLAAIAAKMGRGDSAAETAGGPARWPLAATAPFDLIDNPWHVAARRAERTGIELAERIRRRRDFGRRPLSLIGFSLGSRVIFGALEDLARTGELGIVYQAILMGGAFTADPPRWERVRRVVSGRLVNAYCTSDWVLAVAYRAAEFKSHAAGLGPVDVAGVENVDVTHLAGGHLGYEAALGRVLRRIGIVP